MRDRQRAAVGEGDFFLGGDLHQPLGDVAPLDAAEFKALAARENRRGDFVQLGGGEDKHDMLRRLLQNFQKRVEGALGEHVHLVHDIDLFAQLRGRVDRLVAQVADAVDAGIGRRVELEHIRGAAVVDAEAGGAGVAGVAVHGRKAVGGLGEDARAGRFARAARPAEQIGVRKPVLRRLIFQGAGDVLLSDHVVEAHRTPFVVQRKTHSADNSFEKRSGPGTAIMLSKGGQTAAARRRGQDGFRPAVRAEPERSPAFSAGPG